MEGKYEIYVDDVPIAVDHIYKDKIDNFTLTCTPLSMNGIHLLTQGTLKILNQCNGRMPINEIAQSVQCDREYVKGVINSLWQIGLIKINGKLPMESQKENYTKPSIKQIDVWLHITNRCNFSCSYCYIKKTNEEMSRETAYLAIDNLAKSALLHGKSGVRLKFTGGEPLLRFSFIKDLVEYSKSCKYKGVNFTFHILTNGTLLSK